MNKTEGTAELSQFEKLDDTQFKVNLPSENERMAKSR